MRVLVTGGAGSVGRAVVEELVARGHAVTVAGRREVVEVAPAAYRQLDITNLDSVVRVLDGHDGVIHLAAIPSPEHEQADQLFDINVRGTYHVFEAAERLGLRQVVTASSINALGARFGVKPVPVRYLPVDEAHPSLTTDPYSLSKQLVEELGRYFWDRAGIASVALRIPAVLRPSERRLEHLRRVRQEWLTTGPVDWAMHMARDFFVTVDARDSARAFAAAVEADLHGAEPLFINDADNCYALPTRALAAAAWPEVSDFRAPLDDCQAPITCTRARDVLGWTPIHSWRRAVEGGELP